MERTGRIFPALALIAVTACGSRASYWDTTLDLPVKSVGLSGSVAVVDPSLDRVLMLTSPSGRGLASTPLRIGKNVAATAASPDRGTLFVLSSGVQPRKSPKDERPSLTVIDGGASPSVHARFTLTDPLHGLAIDPEGEWAVVYDAGGIVVNPNELILVNLKDPKSQPISKTIRSFGGRPQRLSFTSTLSLPKGPERMLIVQTEQDVTLVSLTHPDQDEVTVPLPRTSAGATGSPAEVAWSDGDAGDPTDARIAVRLAGDSNVAILQLGPTLPSEPDKDFHAVYNVADVGGVPTAIDFVQTDGGLRLAALVPNKKIAALVDPATTVVENVDLGKAYTHLTRVTADVAQKPVSSDVALLWSEQATGVAFWSLGVTSGTPFRSVDSYDIGISVADVLNVPGDAYAHLKILESAGASEFYVLDLDKRTSFPMLTDAAGFTLSISPDGQRAWALKPGTPDFAQIDFQNLHPTSLTVERDVSAVYDVARLDGGRSAIALHEVAGTGTHAALGATVLDALSPDTADTRFYSGLTLGGHP